MIELIDFPEIDEDGGVATRVQTGREAILRGRPTITDHGGRRCAPRARRDDAGYCCYLRRSNAARGDAASAE